MLGGKHFSIFNFIGGGQFYFVTCDKRAIMSLVTIFRVTDVSPLDFLNYFLSHCFIPAMGLVSMSFRLFTMWAVPSLYFLKWGVWMWLW